MTAPDKEVDAGDTRVEKDNGVDYEGDGVPERIKGAALLYFHRHVPLGRCRSIQPKHGHRNDPWRYSKILLMSESPPCFLTRHKLIWLSLPVYKGQNTIPHPLPST